MKRTEIRKLFLNMVEDVVLPLGFEKYKTNEGWEYKQATESGFVKVLPLINHYGICDISLVFSLQINDISQILAMIENINEKYRDDYPTLSFGIGYLTKIHDNSFRIETPEELEVTLNIIKNVLENDAMRFFENIQSVADLDKDMNRDNRPKDLYCHEMDRVFIGLIAAVLNNNPQKKYWEEYYRDKVKKANQYTQSQYEKLVEYLQQNYNL